MDLVGIFFKELASNPAIQAAVLGLVVKTAVDRLKVLFVALDADGTKTYKIQVQVLVAVCSLLATLGDLYLKSQLHTYDPNVLMSFITIALPAYLNALGIHLFTNNVKLHIEKLKDAGK